MAVEVAGLVETTPTVIAPVGLQSVQAIHVSQTVRAIQEDTPTLQTCTFGSND